MSSLGEFENYNVLEKASVGRRIFASIIDFIIFYFVCILLALLTDSSTESVFSFHLEGLPAFIAFLMMLFFWPVSEGLFGQTIGKRTMDVKVVSKNKSKISFGQAFGRFFLGIFDFMILIGIIIALVNKENQRIGDLATGTFVVKSKYNE